MSTRADKIFNILKISGNRLKVASIVQSLAKMEGTAELQGSFISSTVYMDCITREMQGRAPRFNRFGDGTEKHGYVSIRNVVRVANDLHGILKRYEQQVPAIIEKANWNTRQQLKEAIRQLSWREFESYFLLRILEALGFQSIEITQASHDNGTDAFCTYKRGLVQSQAIVSAKHWRQNVGKTEIQRLRGIKGAADTGIIVTSACFTHDAIREAEPSQNQRAVVLIDADVIVETCFNHSIGVECIALPKLYKYTNLSSYKE